jgi:hypothetical protein
VIQNIYLGLVLYFFYLLFVVRIDISPLVLFLEVFILSVGILGRLFILISLSIASLSLIESSHLTKERPCLMSIENSKDFYKFF